MTTSLREILIGFSLVALAASLIEGLVLTWRNRAYDWRAAGASLLIALGRRLTDLVPLWFALPGAAWLYAHRLFDMPMDRWWSWAMLFVGLEFFYYWFHRASHRVRWFWNTHAVHHSTNGFNFSAAYRLGWTSKLTFALIFFVPLAWLGFPPPAIAAAFAINLLYQFWIHAEWIGKLGPLEGALNTPSAHRVHHAANLEYLDANYGGVLIVFDRLFGTYIPERDDLPCRYGLVKPLTSNNPLLIVFHQWIAAWHDLKRARNLRDAVGYLFGPPGWAPGGKGETTADMRRRACRRLTPPAPSRKRQDKPAHARSCEGRSMKRRLFLIAGIGVGASLVVGCGNLPVRSRMFAARPLPGGVDEVPMNGWLKIAADGSVIAAVPKSEMGQGVTTALAMLIAEELDCDWKRLRVEHPPVDKIYNNIATIVDGLPFRPDDDGLVKRSARWIVAGVMREFGMMMTGGSSSIKDLWMPMREAGAAARATLVQAAAASWGVPAAQCQVADGIIIHPAGKRMHFGEVVTQIKSLSPATSWTLKDPKSFKLIGTRVPRIDSQAKVDGSARFGIDALPPGLLYAAVTMCPTLGGAVRKVDDGKARTLPGVRHIVQVPGSHGGTDAVAVIADNWHRARKAVEALTIDWDAGPAQTASSAALMSQLAAAAKDKDGFGFWKAGDPEGALKSAAKRIEAEYRVPYLAHAPLEPMNCTVQFKDGKAHVWASTQVPGMARTVVAKALGISEDAVDVEVMALGGGFGRRLDVDFIAQAAHVARAVAGTPVQTLWTREEDMRHDFYRPACVARSIGGLDAGGRLIAWKNTSAGQSIVRKYMPRAAGLPVAGPDKTTSEGAFDQPYRIANVRVAHESLDYPVPVGFWRSVGHSHQAFFTESFIDEAAHAAGADPVAFRLGMLADRPRHAAVLRLAAERAGWSSAPGKAADGAPIARGVALNESFGSIVAEVAEVSIGPEQAIRVHKVTCAIDCGLAVNPQIIEQQIESAIVFGMSAALHGGIDIVEGRVRQGNYHDYRILRFDEAPVIQVHIVPSGAHPEGVGEPGLPPVAPAIANAVFAATGTRLRSLPLALARQA